MTPTALQGRPTVPGAQPGIPGQQPRMPGNIFGSMAGQGGNIVDMLMNTFRMGNTPIGNVLADRMQYNIDNPQPMRREVNRGGSR